MSAKKKTDSVTRLENKLARIKAEQRKKFVNEDVIRLAKNGDICYESIRTVGVRADGTVVDRDGNVLREENAPQADTAEIEQPIFYPETPDSSENGQKIDACTLPADGSSQEPAQTELAVDEPFTAGDSLHEQSASEWAASGISIHDAQSTGQQIPAPDAESADPLEELLARALTRPKRGRPAVFDDHSKGKLVALLSLGMSLRQAAAVLGVAHGTIRNTLKADPALAEEITAARFQAQLQPLACVIREARRSWKAATWLLKYLDSKIASHEETPDERRERQARESEEFFARGRNPGVKTRRFS